MPARYCQQIAAWLATGIQFQLAVDKMDRTCIFMFVISDNEEEDIGRNVNLKERSLNVNCSIQTNNVWLSNHDVIFVLLLLKSEWYFSSFAHVDKQSQTANAMEHLPTTLVQIGGKNHPYFSGYC